MKSKKNMRKFKRERERLENENEWERREYREKILRENIKRKYEGKTWDENKVWDRKSSKIWEREREEDKGKVRESEKKRVKKFDEKMRERV